MVEEGFGTPPEPSLAVFVEIKKRSFERLKKDGRLSSFVSSQAQPQLGHFVTV